MKRILCIVTMLAIFGIGSQALAFTLTMSPLTQSIGNSGDDTATVNIGVTAAGPEALEAFLLTLTFDSEVLQLVSFASPSIPMKNKKGRQPFKFSKWYTGGFTYQPTIDPDFVGIDGALKSHLHPLAGTFTLATLTFSGLNAGTSELNLTSQLLSDSGTLYEQNLTSNITVVPEPGTFLLMGLGLVGIVAFRKKAAHR